MTAFLVPGRHRRHDHPARYRGHDRVAGPAYGDTISPEPTSRAGSPPPCSNGNARVSRPSMFRCSVAGWAMVTFALTSHLNQLMVQPPGVHGSPINPLVGLYANADDRYIPVRHDALTKFWADVQAHGSEQYHDPLSATAEGFAENTPAAVEILTEAMKKRTLPEERAVRDARRIRAPVQDTLQAAQDAQIRGQRILRPRSNWSWWPIRCSSTSAHRARSAPGFAEQTDDILSNWARLAHHRAQDGRRVT